MATKKELEERIEQLEEKFQGLSQYCTDTKHILNEHRWKVYDRIEKKFQELKDEIHDLKIDRVRKDWGIPEKDPRLQRYDELQHDLQQGKIDFAEFLEKLPDSETPKMKEPDYLQVGDQWRDEEGNEYVLVKVLTGTECSFTETGGITELNTYCLANKETGQTFGKYSQGKNSSIKPPQNSEFVRGKLGITDSMTKIK